MTSFRLTLKGPDVSALSSPTASGPTSFSVSDEDAGLISTDAKGLKVSLTISHCNNCGGAESNMERERETLRTEGGLP